MTLQPVRQQFFTTEELDEDVKAAAEQFGMKKYDWIKMVMAQAAHRAKTKQRPAPPPQVTTLEQ